MLYNLVNRIADSFSPILPDSVDRDGNVAEIERDMKAVDRLAQLEALLAEFSNNEYPSISPRTLYTQLLNADDHPEILPYALEFFKEHAAIALAHARADAKSSLEKADQGMDASSLGSAMRDGYTPAKLDDFMLKNHQRTMDAYHDYREEWDLKFEAALAESANGENVNVDYRKVNRMFPTPEFARWGLAVCAPTKLVDGSWLQNALNIELPTEFRSYARPLFHTFAEELGAGIPVQNHVNVYNSTLHSENMRLPAHSTLSFSHAPMLPTEAFHRGTIQLILGHFASSLLFPETLGYNMGYEQLPLHLLVTCHEFETLNIDASYFRLHVTIDNAANGHAHMAIAAVKHYLEFIRSRDGVQA